MIKYKCQFLLVLYVVSITASVYSQSPMDQSSSEKKGVKLELLTNDLNYQFKQDYKCDLSDRNMIRIAAFDGKFLMPNRYEIRLEPKVRFISPPVFSPSYANDSHRLLANSTVFTFGYIDTLRKQEPDGAILNLIENAKEEYGGFTVAHRTRKKGDGSRMKDNSVVISSENEYLFWSGPTSESWKIAIDCFLNINKS